MRKTLVFLLVFVSSNHFLFAQHNRFEIRPAEGMPVTQIYNIPSIDLSQIADDGLVTFELYLWDLDFELAAFQLSVYYPAPMLLMSPNQADWQAGVGAVFRPADKIQSAWRVPHDSQGIQTVPNYAGSLYTGFVSFGVVIQDPSLRMHGSGSQTHPGGLLGTISFRKPGYQNQFCKTSLDSVQVLLTPGNVITKISDYFSDQNGNRIAITNQIEADALHRVSGKPYHVGYPGMRLWADANLDDLLNSYDTMACLYCAVLGQNEARCTFYDFQAQQARPWSLLPESLFNQIFNINCSSGDHPVDAIDALRLIHQTLLLRSSGTRSSPPSFYEANNTSDIMRISFSNARGSIFLSLKSENILFSEATIQSESEKQGWVLLQEKTLDGIDCVLFNPNENQILPEITILKAAKGYQSLYYTLENLDTNQRSPLSATIR